MRNTVSQIIGWSVFAVSLAVLLWGCLPERAKCPTALKWRCDGDQAQLCTGDGLWEPVGSSCGEVYRMDGEVDNLKCCEVDGGAFCLEECE